MVFVKTIRARHVQLSLFLHDIYTFLDRNILIHALRLDLEKAFDKVPYTRLLLRLSLLNMHQSVLRWIQAFLTVINSPMVMHIHRLSRKYYLVFSKVCLLVSYRKHASLPMTVLFTDP